MNYLFRGKRKDNGEWVYGSLVNIDYHNSVDYVNCSQIVLENGHVFEVIPETIICVQIDNLIKKWEERKNIYLNKYQEANEIEFDHLTAVHCELGLCIKELQELIK